MEFCSKCGAILVQTKKTLKCPRCGRSSRAKSSNITVSEKIIEHESIGGVVADKGEQLLPIVAETCKKCGNNRVYFWTIQTRSGDEAETKFFKCTKCDYTWREYK